MTVMDNEDPALTGPTEDEAWYDAEIAPALSKLATQCHRRGMSFLAVVEYEPGERGGTYYMTEEAGLEMRMLHIAACTVPNVDRYVLALRRHCKDVGQDMSGSFVLHGIAPKAAQEKT